MKDKIKYLSLLVAVLLIALLSLANMQSVEINFLFGHVDLPLIILILLSVILGAVVSSLMGMSKSLSINKELKQTRKELETAVKEKTKALASKQTGKE